MFENIGSFLKKMMKNDQKELLAESTNLQSKDAAKERLHVVLMQDRANVSSDFLELMKDEIIDVIKKYIVIDESQIDVRLTNQENEDGSIGVPILLANIPILNVRNDIKGEYLGDSTSIDIIKKVEEKVDDNEVKDDIPFINNIKEEINEEVKEVEPNIVEQAIKKETEKVEEEDEEDDDVTFDDLLKAAEEEERQNNELVEKVESKKEEINKEKKTVKKTTRKVNTTKKLSKKTVKN